MIFWLTDYDVSGLQTQIEAQADMETFFMQAPLMNPNSVKITGVVCGVRVEDPLMQKNRRLDKLIDEPAHGNPWRGS